MRNGSWPIQKKKILSKIAELKEQRTKLQKKLKKELALNRAAWDTYGSELCAAELESNVQTIYNEIKKNDEDIELLTEWQWVHMTLDDLISHVEARLREVSGEMKTLEEKKNRLETDLAKKKRFKQLIEST